MKHITNKVNPLTILRYTPNNKHTPNVNSNADKKNAAGTDKQSRNGIPKATK
jgi:hypothetical protein